MVTAIEPIPTQKIIPPKLSCSHQELELIMKLLQENKQEELAEKYLAQLEEEGYTEPIKPLFMAFKDYKKILKVTDAFQLKLKQFSLFPATQTVEPNDLLTQLLEIGLEYAPISEKEKSEWLIQPVLDGFRLMSDVDFHLYSGRYLKADKHVSLKRECDFLYAFTDLRVAVQGPIFAAIESKAETIQQGTAQCAAQMMGVYHFNEQREVPLEVIYGCVTTGYDWRFMRLKNNELCIDTRIYHTDKIEQILGIWNTIVEECRVKST